MQKCIATIFLEIVIFFAFFSTHWISQILRPFNRWLKRLRISAEYVAKVNVENFATFANQNVIIMSITNTEYVRDYYVAGFLY